MSLSSWVYLFRHGRSASNEQAGVICGRCELTPLVEQGVAEAAELGRHLLRSGLAPSSIFSSPTVRARSTAKVALATAEISMSVIEDERLHEQCVGMWVGKLGVEVFTDDCLLKIEKAGKDFRPPNGESMNDVGRRMLAWLTDISLDVDDGPVLAFTHGGAIRALASTIHDWSHARTYATRPPNASVSLLRRRAGGWHAEYLGRHAAEAFTSVVE